MKIILNTDVLNLGEEGDVKIVANGYARNFLIPKKLAMPYNKKNQIMLESKKAIIEKKKEEKRQAALGLKERLEETEILIKMPAGESGKLFGSVNPAMISDELVKSGFTIEKKKIDIPDKHIRTVGDFKVSIKLYAQETAALKVKVEAAADSE